MWCGNRQMRTGKSKVCGRQAITEVEGQRLQVTARARRNEKFRTTVPRARLLLSELAIWIIDCA